MIGSALALSLAGFPFAGLLSGALLTPLPNLDQRVE